MSLQEKINKITAKKGEVRGEVILKSIDFIKREKGKVGFQKLKNTLADLDFETDFTQINPLDWLDASLLTTILILSKDLFDWTDRDFVEMGSYTPKNSIVNKLFIDHFNSHNALLEVIDDYWQKIFTFGNLEVKDKKDKEITITISNYDFHPLNCFFISGLLETLFSLSIKGNAKVKEEKCIHQGDSVHQFSIKW
jgi:hypothetical protein